MDTASTGKPTKYYIDFENVHGAGLKGVDQLGERDVVYIFYSQAAETFHIEHAIDIMKSKASIEFVEIDGGTRNSLDFQLVAALFGRMTDDYEYAIVSGDGGFDAAIKMGKRLELPEVKRITDLTGSTESPQTKSRSSRSRSRQRQAAQKQEKAAASESPAEGEPASAAPPEPTAPQEGDVAQDVQDAPGTRQGQGEPASEQPQPEQDVKPGRSRRRRTTQKKAQAPDKQEEAPSAADTAPEIADDAALAADPEPSAQAPAEPEAPGEALDSGAEAEREHAKSGRYSRRKEVRALLADAGVKLDQQQLGAVMNALNGVKNKQDFYKRIIQSEKRERGLALYRQVRDHYESMVDILRA